MRVLLLGGTTEASRLAAALALRPDVDATMSLAGRTATPARAAIPVRVGGFGGGEGLAAYLRESRTQLLIDATHPFAARMAANAVAASRLVAVPLLRFSRPPWVAAPGDRWTVVPDIAAAAAHLATLPERSVFLTTGRLDVRIFRAAPQHRYLMRSIEAPPPEELPPSATVLLDRGPFDLAAERALMEAHGVTLLVSKNSGGTASEAKLAAARDLGVPVLLVARPAQPDGREERHDLADVLASIDAHAGSPR